MPKFTTLSGASVHPFAFGTMQMGGKADEADSHAMYAACRDAGIAHFDTAWAYQGGKTEQILGGLIARERDQVFIATKAANDKVFSADIINSQFDESRARLGIDVIDLFYLHQWDPVTPLDEPLKAIAAHVDAGRIRHVAVSNFSAWQVMLAQGIAAREGIRIDAIQPMYNLVKRQAEVEILPMAEDQDVAVFPYSPLGGGLLTGKYAHGDDKGRIKTDAMYSARYAPAWMHDAAAGLSEVARVADVHPATLAVAWAAHHSGVTGPIISARNVEQLRPSLDAINFHMTDALYREVSTLSPAPPPANDRLEETS